MGKKRNWDQIRGQKATDTAKYRDVYESQQLKRGSIQEVQTMTSRNILNGICTGLVFILLWVAISAIQMFFRDTSHERSGNPAADWVHINACYVNSDDESDKITPEEYQDLVTAYSMGLMTSDDARDPADVYYEQVEHYRSVDDLSQYILVDDYKALVQSYEDKRGSLSDDLKDVPDPPFDISMLYEPYEYDYIDLDAEKSSLDAVLSAGDTGLSSVDDQEAKGEKNEKGETRVAVVYRNKYDGTKLSRADYKAAVAQYEKDHESFLTAYWAHREAFHPDNVDGSALILDLSPNMVKFSVCGIVCTMMFLILYAVLRKNLDAQNVMSDTADINQYKNDQHVALPEEVQRKYDWFPDVGAHSAVQVSSMISHMAILNKGLKSVKLAKRASEDIKDSDGDIEKYKGEILTDADGNPLTSMVPIIDTDFMEDLFDASGAPKDKDVRRYYDATKIPYNPDGSDRDKLGKYGTVADLINEDWEFPIYEPQRPAGAYIVDTAPVNTINERCTA